MPNSSARHDWRTSADDCRKGLRSTRTSLAALVSATAIAASPAVAQDATSRPSTIRNLVDCIRIPEDVARLRCFDRSAEQLNKELAGRQIAILDGDGVKRTRRSLFGFALPSVGLFGKDGPGGKEEISEVDGSVAKLVTLPNQRFELVLADGARWQTTEPANQPFDVGDKVHIRRGALGSFWISSAPGRAVRGRRIG